MNSIIVVISLGFGLILFATIPPILNVFTQKMSRIPRFIFYICLISFLAVGGTTYSQEWLGFAGITAKIFGVVGFLGGVFLTLLKSKTGPGNIVFAVQDKLFGGTTDSGNAKYLFSSPRFFLMMPWEFIVEEVKMDRSGEKESEVRSINLMIEPAEKGAPLLVEATYTEKPDIQNLQNYLENSLNDDAARERFLKKTFDALVRARISNLLRNKTVDELRGSEYDINQQLRTMGPFPEEERYGEHIGEIIVGNIDYPQIISETLAGNYANQSKYAAARESLEADGIKNPTAEQIQQRVSNQNIASGHGQDIKFDGKIDGLEGADSASVAHIVAEVLRHIKGGKS